MRIRRIPYLVNRLHCRVNGCIKADGEIRTRNIFVNSARQADAGDVELLAELQGAAERAIAANHYQSVNIMFLQVLIRFLSPTVFHEFLAAGRLQDSAAPLNDIGY